MDHNRIRRAIRYAKVFQKKRVFPPLASSRNSNTGNYRIFIRPEIVLSTYLFVRWNFFLLNCTRRSLFTLYTSLSVYNPYGKLWILDFALVSGLTEKKELDLFCFALQWKQIVVGRERHFGGSRVCAHAP